MRYGTINAPPLKNEPERRAHGVFKENAGTSFVVDGTWGGFYLWKSKNENRAKYAQKFVRLFAKEYGVENAIRLAEIVLKD